jgi:hypothetical protein
MSKTAVCTYVKGIGYELMFHSITKKYMEQYAKITDSHFFVIKESLGKKKVSADKIIIFEYLKDYDQILFIDVDCYISPKKLPNVFEQMEKSDKLVGTIFTDIRRYNTMFFIIKKEILNYIDYKSHNDSWDNEEYWLYDKCQENNLKPFIFENIILKQVCSKDDLLSLVTKDNFNIAHFSFNCCKDLEYKKQLINTIEYYDSNKTLEYIKAIKSLPKDIYIFDPN